jgi:hypothetical protein
MISELGRARGAAAPRLVSSSEVRARKRQRLPEESREGPDPPGAAGTTALNAVTYLDMAVHGRPSSSTPEDTFEALSSKTHVPVPGEGDTRQNRLQGLGKRLRSSVG